MSNWSFEGWAPSLPSSSPRPSSSLSSSALRRFTLAEIRKATNNFDQALVLRHGWLSKVYKGTYNDYDGKEKTITIKSFLFKSSSRIPLLWFEKELEAWSLYRHKHVVTVIGYCREGGACIIVYEYMPNGSLANHLCTKTTPARFCLSWEECLHICIDGARGLEYMHTQIRYSDCDSYYHSDVTPSNILLDGNGVAKISDLYNETFAREHEPAYLFDPEYHSTGSRGPSSDVYAFGVLLVKVLSRKVSFDKEDRNLGIWLNKCIVDGTIHQIIHPDVKAQVSPDCLEAFIHIAGECLNEQSRRRPSFTHVVKKLELLSTPSSSQRLCNRYSLQEIEDATNKFKSSILGQGGEGTVYKGLTKTNSSVAVKRLKPEYSSEFQKEIEMLSDLDHENLVSLVGYCHETDEGILIYEFMCHGNLAQNLYGRMSTLTWKQRLNICIGAARGLRYLHTRTNSSHRGIIHRDVKPANILLDENFNAKVSDFGLSKKGPQDQANSEISTMVKGTTGYYAPEYQRYGKITRKIDVYAFGVVLSEVLCRKKPWDREESFYPTENEKYVEWAKENIDPDLEGEIAPGCLEAFTSILEKCLNMNPKRRPSMNDVVSVLEYAMGWQEAWQTYKSGGDFCLPCGEDRVVLYYSSNLPQHTKLRSLMRSYNVQVDERDLKKDIHANDFKYVVFKETVDIRLPQAFVRGMHIGNVNEIQKLHTTGELSEILEAPSPKFICDSCGEARACDACKRTRRFLHCEDCDALTEIWKEWESDLRSCLECDGDHPSIYRVTATGANKAIKRTESGLPMLGSVTELKFEASSGCRSS